MSRSVAVSETPFERAWFLVPARGGSRGIPRKNLKQLGDKPLVLHVLSTLASIAPKNRVLLSTEDAEIAIVGAEYATVLARPPELAGDAITLDEVALHVAQELMARGDATEDDLLLTVQPTSPFISAAALARGAKALLAGASSVLTVRDDRHLRWTVEDGEPKPLFEARVNRQQLPADLSETGGLIGVRLRDLLARRTRIVSPIALVELSGKEALDIDTHADFALAKHYVEQLAIVLRADSSPDLGMGHVHRALALAHEWAHHDLHLVTRNDGPFELGARFLGEHPFVVHGIAGEHEFETLLEELQPDLAVLDVLDTSVEQLDSVHKRASFVVCLEDLGPGATRADLVVNDLYTDHHPAEHHWYGVQHAVLAPQFETAPRREREQPPTVRHVLLAFGGSDPCRLTLKAVQALAEASIDVEVRVVLGHGYAHEEPDLEAAGLGGMVVRSVQNMAAEMAHADLALTSAGRTVTELMVMGVPTVVMCQNARELRHTHASAAFGVMNLGLGEHVTAASLGKHIRHVALDAQLRRDMVRRARDAVRDRSNRGIADRILERLREGRHTS